MIPAKQILANIIPFETPIDPSQTSNTKIQLKSLLQPQSTQKQQTIDAKELDKRELERQFNLDLLVKEGFSPVQAEAIQSLVKESIESG